MACDLARVWRCERRVRRRGEPSVHERALDTPTRGVPAGEQQAWQRCAHVRTGLVRRHVTDADRHRIGPSAAPRIDRGQAPARLRARSPAGQTAESGGYFIFDGSAIVSPATMKAPRPL